MANGPNIFQMLLVITSKSNTLKDVENRSDIALLNDDAVLVERDRVHAVHDLAYLRILEFLQEVVVDDCLSYQRPHAIHTHTHTLTQ